MTLLTGLYIHTCDTVPVVDGMGYDAPTLFRACRMAYTDLANPGFIAPPYHNVRARPRSRCGF